MQQFDISIIGGGLAGLSLSIQMADLGYRTVLFEKEQYPFHKVCGEYISMESWGFIERLGLPLSNMHLPVIKKLIITTLSGIKLEQKLPLGGFGISRYTLDQSLKEIATAKGVQVMDNCKVEDVIFLNDCFEIFTTQGKFTSKLCCGSFGKRSNLDIKWNRSFLLQKASKFNNYIGIKYHIKTAFPADTIALHNFKNGYCGISRVENDTYCLCYLTNAKNLKDNDNSIQQMEKNVLHKNPYLKSIFENAEMVYSSPLAISQISFARKTQVENDVLLLGDAAGMITPLCGNGMSMALHSSKIAVLYMNQFLKGSINRKTLQDNYTHHWKQVFSGRLQTGRQVQKLLGKDWITNFFIGMMKKMPFLTKKLIERTHGKPF